jgi:hypothetical protein
MSQGIEKVLLFLYYPLYRLLVCKLEIDFECNTESSSLFRGGDLFKHESNPAMHNH